MPLNIRKTLVVGGLTIFGFLAGGKLGSLLGKFYNYPNL